MFYYILCSVVLFILSRSVDALVEESGCALENIATAKFRMCVMAGNWKQVLLHLLIVDHKNISFILSKHFTIFALYGQVFFVM